MTMTKIAVETVISAPVKTVWEFWTKPEHIVKWAFASDDWEAPHAENDVRVGGKFKTVMAAKDKSTRFDFAGIYTSVKNHELIEYDMGDGRHVKVEFAQLPEGVRVTETFETEKINPEEMQRSGWQAILGNFKKYAEAQSWIKILEQEGFMDVRVCPIPPNQDSPEHTHDEHTVHVILNGGLTITYTGGTKVLRPGDRVEFPAGTTHKARGATDNGTMVIGVKTNKQSTQKIVPHLWFDKEAREAAAFYTYLFKDSKVKNITTITGTPSGDCDIVAFGLSGQDFMAISAGPYFKLNPSISLFVVFDNEAEIAMVWNKLIGGGKALMPYDSYHWAHKYGWLQDKYGLSWQLSWSEHHKMGQKITPLLMFTKDMAGKAKDAIEAYTSIFPNSKIELLVPYTRGDGDKEGFIKHSRFTLDGQNFMAMDSSLQHDFSFNEAISFVVNCDTQEQIDYYWGKLSAVPEAEQCGWLKDKYGVSWQIVPSAMNEMMASGSKEKIAQVTKAFLKMKKFDIEALKQAYEGK